MFPCRAVLQSSLQWIKRGKCWSLGSIWTDEVGTLSGRRKQKERGKTRVSFREFPGSREISEFCWFFPGIYFGDFFPGIKIRDPGNSRAIWLFQISRFSGNEKVRENGNSGRDQTQPFKQPAKFKRDPLWYWALLGHKKPKNKTCRDEMILYTVRETG